MQNFCYKRFDELTTVELYEMLGFHVTSETFIEAGVPHVEMRCEI